MEVELDDVDRGILHILQDDARNVTAREMSEAIDVSASTIHNRIEQLEDGGVIRGYHPEIDYARAGFQLYMRFACRASPDRRAERARQVMGLDGVVRVRELMTGPENLEVEAVGVDAGSVDDVVEAIVGLGLDIVDADVVTSQHVQPFDQFGDEDADC